MTDVGPASDTPNWETLALELHCPRCGYDLRRLPQPRCPECGLQFQWAELIAATERQLQSPLFEYQWRHRPVRSFFGTIGRAMLPWRLWPETRIALEPRLVPLLVFVLLMLLLHAVVCLSTEYGSSTFMDWWCRTRFGWTPYIAGQLADLNAYLLALLGALLLVVLTWLVLQVFQQTINRYRIRWQHFLRILALAGTAAWMWHAVVGVLFCLNCVIATCTPSGVWRWRAWAACTEYLVWLAMILPISVFALAISLGMGRYLQVRRGWAIGFLTTFIVLLFLVTSVVALTMLLGRPNNFWWRAFGKLWPGLADLVWYLLVH